MKDEGCLGIVLAVVISAVILLGVVVWELRSDVARIEGRLSSNKE